MLHCKVMTTTEHKQWIAQAEYLRKRDTEQREALLLAADKIINGVAKLRADGKISAKSARILQADLFGKVILGGGTVESYLG